MEDVIFHFHRGSSIISKIVQWRTNSSVSHVSIEVRGYRYNAYLSKRFSRSRGRPDSIVESHSLRVSEEEADVVEKVLVGSLGTKYDKKSLLGFLVNKRLEDENRWFCSEIAMYLLLKSLPEEFEYRKLVSPAVVKTAIRFYNLGLQKGNTSP